VSNAQFFQTWLSDARTASKQTGVLPSVILAQWADETAYGTSHAFVVGNNFAGVSYSGLSSFSSQAAGLAAYIAVLNQHIYDPVRKASGAQSQALALGRSPWAASHYDMADYDAAGQPADGTWSAPKPGADLLGIISQFNLSQFDAGAGGGAASSAQAVSVSSAFTPDVNPPAATFQPGQGPNNLGTLYLAGAPMGAIPLPGAPLPAGQRLSGAVIVQGSEVDLSSDEVSQVSLMFSDPNFAIFDSGVMLLGSEASWLGWPLLVGVLETSDGGGGGLGGGGMGAGGQLKVQLRSKGAQLLKQRWGAKQWTNLSPTQVMQGECSAVGLNFVGEGSAVRGEITRLDQTLGGQYLVDYTTGEYIVPDTSWSLGQELAAECGFVAFEAFGTYYFARPSWLANNMPVIDIRWPGRREDDQRFVPLGPPQWRRSLDDMDGLAILRGIDASTLTLVMDRAVGEMIRPGFAIDFTGVSDKTSGRYIVTGVHWYLDNGVTGVEVDCQRPVDPIPTLPGQYSGALASSNQALPAAAQGTSISALAFVQLAESQSGKSYVYGATDPTSNSSPTSFDCSSLVQWCAGRLGVSLPRTSGDQWSACASLDISVAAALKVRGALLFVDSAGVPGGDHVGISTGDGKNVIEAYLPPYGVGIYPSSWSRWNRAALMPMFDYGYGVGKPPPGVRIGG
jgi:hypothetical protein